MIEALPVAVTRYELSIFLHITAVMVGFGGQFWVSAALVIVLVIGGLIGGYFIPTDRRLGPMAERDIAASGDREVVLSDEYQHQARMEGIVGTVTGILLVVAVYLMVTKPGV
jgi:hypothetical protein